MIDVIVRTTMIDVIVRNSVTNHKDELATALFRECAVRMGGKSIFSSLVQVCTEDATSPIEAYQGLSKAWGLFMHHVAYHPLKWYGRKRNRQDLLPAQAEDVYQDALNEMIRRVVELSRQDAEILRLYAESTEPKISRDWEIVDSREKVRKQRVPAHAEMLGNGSVSEWLDSMQAINDLECSISVFFMDTKTIQSNFDARVKA